MCNDDKLKSPFFEIEKTYNGCNKVSFLRLKLIIIDDTVIKVYKALTKGKDHYKINYVWLLADIGANFFYIVCILFRLPLFCFVECFVVASIFQHFYTFSFDLYCFIFGQRWDIWMFVPGFTHFCI